MPVPVKLPKFLNLRQTLYCVLLAPVKVKYSAYEYDEAGPGIVYPTGGNFDWLNIIDVMSNTEAGFGTGPNDIHSYRSLESGKFSRPDLLLISASFDGYNWHCTFHVRGNLYNTAALYPGRGIGVYLIEYKNGVAWKGTQIFRVFVKPQAGVASTQGIAGSQHVTIEAATLGHFLDSGAEMQIMSYMYQPLVAPERSYWTSNVQDENVLGYRLYDSATRGEGFGGLDIFRGFGQPINRAALLAGPTLSLPPANGRHFLPALSPAHAIREMLNNHIRVHRGSGYATLENAGFTIEMEEGADGTTDLKVHDIGPGSPHSVMVEQTAHGAFLYWWDAQSNMHYILDDFYRTAAESRTPFLKITSTTSMLGECTVIPPPGDLYPLVSRVIFTSVFTTTTVTDNRSNPLQAHITLPRGAVYPAGVDMDEREGKELVFDKMCVSNPRRGAAGEYSRATSTGSLTMTDCPFVGMAVALANRVIEAAYNDPKKNFYGVTSPMKFVANSVNIQLQGEDEDGAGGGVYLATIGGRQINDLPADW